jgi:hypothetical protein
MVLTFSAILQLPCRVLTGEAFAMYKPVDSREIIDRVEHIRELHRQIHRSNDRERVAHQRREQKIKDFISNLRRTGTRPMANMVRDIEEACSLTTDGAYRLFGYELDGIREFDLHLNGGRTHMYCLHEGLSAAEADGSLGAGYICGTSKCECSQRWPRDVRRAEKLSFEE